MTSLRLFSTLLLAGTVLSQQPLFAQDAGGQAPPATVTPPTGETLADAPDADAAEAEVSAPGSEGLEEIVVTGRFIPNPVRNTAQVVSVLSTEEIARAGDGDIAGALQRVTGLSVTSNGFVYVRGLGDRYSLALLNGLSLPSPEPLRRVVPLDIFPTSIVSSAVVQKSYSVNFPGEYGGGVINLTTASLPKESYLSLGVGLSGDDITTARRGLTYYGSDLDTLGYDDGTRKIPGALGNFTGTVSANVLENEDTLIIQNNGDIPANFSANVSGAYNSDIGDNEFGLIGSLGYSNGWRTRNALQQNSAGGSLNSSSESLRTENRILLNGLLGLGFETPDGHQLRFTNVYIHDTSKIARQRNGFENLQLPFEEIDVSSLDRPFENITYESSFVERQLITSQLVGELEFGDLEVDLRGSYSNSQRTSPYDRATRYRFDGTGYAFQGNNTSFVRFGDLNEDVWNGGVDVAYQLPGSFNAKLSAGYAYSDTSRRFEQLEFQFSPVAGVFRFLSPAALFTDTVIDATGLSVNQVNRGVGQSAYLGDLEVHAGYARADIEIMQGLRLDAGVRYETGDQSVTLLDLYDVSLTGDQKVGKSDSYWLPAATLTWNFADNFQFRVHGSKTIARPQFRELGTILFLDIETDRLINGNPFLQDSQLYNAEARVEFYPARSERLSLAGFYKKIENPIETILTFTGDQAVLLTQNAPEADLYGVEAEVVKYFPLDFLGDADWMASRRLVLSANYTYSKSELKVGDDDTTIRPQALGTSVIGISDPANLTFTSGQALTGQSEHIANLQFGIEDTDQLSQFTVLLSYASDRVVARGARFGNLVDPDIIERPGVHLDVVLRQGVAFSDTGPELELKFEARNLLGTNFLEFQDDPEFETINNGYDVGTTLAISAGLRF